jgi:mRNA-degrading endonuclease YafQ of YafQ-DinJ toxin-antitoxin module
MPFRLLFPKPYQKREKTFLKKHPDLQERYFKTLLLLEQDPTHPSLRLHGLQGQLEGLHSVSISMRYRVTLELEWREEQILLVNVGSHDEAYQ